MQDRVQPTIRYERITDDTPKAELPKTAMMFAGVMALMAVAAFVALQIAFPGGLQSSGNVASPIEVAAQPSVASQPSGAGSPAIEGTIQTDVDWSAQISALSNVSTEGLAVSRLSERWGLGPLQGMGLFHRERRVDVTMGLDPAKFRTAPNQESQRAIVADMARVECEAITRTLADACTLFEAKWSLEQDADRMDLHLSLLFTQKQEFGSQPAGAGGGVYTEKRMTLASQGKTGLKSRTMDGSAKRAALYADAARKCDAMRRRQDNCAIQLILVRTTPEVQSRSITEGWVSLGRVAARGA
ncbi:MAG: hypothetical protein AAFY73_07400 [Pseudomonadota bacterium]